jgi:hypothetical protein
MLYRQERNANKRRGTVAVLCATSFTGILFLTALAIDDGNLMAASRQAQNYADAAALTGCIKLANLHAAGTTPTADLIKTAATLADTQNSFSSMGTSQTLTVNWPPKYTDPNTGLAPAMCVSGTIPNLTVTPKTYLNNTNSVEVYLTFTMNNSIVSGSNTVTVRSVASCTSAASPTMPMLITDPTGAKAFYVTGGTMSLNTAPIQVNSNNATAAAIDNGSATGGNTSAVTATVKAVGGASGSFTPAAKVGGSPVADPFGAVAEPSTLGLTTFNQSVYTPNLLGNVTLTPGYYPNGIYVSDGNLTMNPGLYYVSGGNFWINTTGTVTGNNVTIFHNGSNSSAQLATGYGLNVGIALCPTDNNYTFTAPTSGPYAGMSFFQGSNCTGEAFYDFWGKGALNVGTQYFPNSTLRVWSASNGVINCNELVTKDFKLTGTHEIYGNLENNGFSKVTWNATRTTTRPAVSVYMVE